MKWSETIPFSPKLKNVFLLAQIPTQDWVGYLREREEAAYAKGKEEAEQLSIIQLEQQRKEAVALQNGVLDSLQKALPRLIQESETALMNLALESAQKVVAGIPVDAAVVEAVVREALRQVEDTADMTIQLHTDDLELLRKQQSSLLAGTPETGAFRFTTSSEVTRGGCIIQTRFGLIDARREIKLEQLQKALHA